MRKNLLDLMDSFRAREDWRPAQSEITVKRVGDQTRISVSTWASETYDEVVGVLQGNGVAAYLTHGRSGAPTLNLPGAVF